MVLGLKQSLKNTKRVQKYIYERWVNIGGGGEGIVIGFGSLFEKECPEPTPRHSVLPSSNIWVIDGCRDNQIPFSLTDLDQETNVRCCIDMSRRGHRIDFVM